MQMVTLDEWPWWRGVRASMPLMAGRTRQRGVLPWTPPWRRELGRCGLCLQQDSGSERKSSSESGYSGSGGQHWGGCTERVRASTT